MKRIQDSFGRFFSQESTSSILLISCAFVAIIIANSNLSDLYFSFLQKKFSISAGSFSLSKPIILWINDGLMAIFFFVIGLEIKRELLAGELESWKKSALPVIAAFGGMLVPILIFVSFSHSEQGARGWGIPTATDIAFSLGILTLLGKRVPLSLKVFLTAFAIIDDIGAVLIIAIFYSGEIFWNYIIIALIIYGILVVMTFTRINAKFLYLIIGIVIWYLFLKSGIHPTIAGVLMAFVIPVNRRLGKKTFSRELKEIMVSFDNSEQPGMFLNQVQIEAIDRASCLVENVQPHLQILERKLHTWVAFFIMPVFALANGGVQLITEGNIDLNHTAWHIAVAMIAGKVLGISLFTYTAIKLNIGRLPDRIKMKHIIGLSFLGAVGFTMALFINSLAYTDTAYINSAKFGIIAASLLAGVSGFLILRKTLPKIV